MSLNETYNAVHIGKNLSDKCPIQKCLKQQKGFIAISFKFHFEYTTRKVQKNPEGMKLNETRHLLAYVDDVNTVGENNHHKEKHKSCFRR
jgi:intergrase/recombinase